MKIRRREEKKHHIEEIEENIKRRIAKRGCGRRKYQ